MSLSLSDILNGFTAFGTVAMAFTTFIVIRQNKKYHQDSFKPICVLVPESGVDPCYGRSEILKSRDILPNDPHHGTFEVYASLKNIGVGAAIYVKLEIRIRGIAGYGVNRQISPLAKGETLGDKEHPILIPVTFHERFNSSDFQMACGDSWEILIEYQDCFGNVFYTRHSKNPQKPWTTLGDGSIPNGEPAA